MMFDEDSDDNEAANGSVEDIWKAAFAFELAFYEFANKTERSIVCLNIHGRPKRG